MRRKTAVVLLLALLRAGLLVVAEEPAADRTALGENAALGYYRAFAVMPSLTEEEWKLVDAARTSLTVPLGPDADRLVEFWEPALKLLHEGSAISACDWGLDYSKEGPATLLAHAAVVQRLAYGALFRSCYFWERGQKEAAAEDLKAAFILARHIGSGGRCVPYCVLMQAAIENRLLRGAACYLTDVAAADVLDEMMTELPPLPEGYLISKALLFDKNACLEWSIDGLRSGSGEDAVRSLLAGVTRAPGGQSRSELLRLFEEAARHYEEMAKIMALPPDQFAPRWSAFAEQVEASSNPFTKATLRVIPDIRGFELEMRTRWGMLRAGIAIRKKGVEALETVKDPYDNLPFEYIGHDGTFELKSRLTTPRGEPVTLSFGEPPSVPSEAPEDASGQPKGIVTFD